MKMLTDNSQKWDLLSINSFSLSKNGATGCIKTQNSYLSKLYYTTLLNRFFFLKKMLLFRTKIFTQEVFNPKAINSSPLIILWDNHDLPSFLLPSMDGIKYWEKKWLSVNLLKVWNGRINFIISFIFMCWFPERYGRSKNWMCLQTQPTSYLKDHLSPITTIQVTRMGKQGMLQVPPIREVYCI